MLASMSDFGTVLGVFAFGALLAWATLRWLVRGR